MKSHPTSLPGHPYALQLIADAWDSRERLDALNAAAPELRDQTRVEDSFPHDALKHLFELGVSTAFGLYDIPPLDLMEAFRVLGRIDLSLGRLFEGHINALALVRRYGDTAQRAELNTRVLTGEIYGVWNTEGSAGVRIEIGTADQILAGAKTYASGAGHIDRAVVTAMTPLGRQMLIVPADDQARADAASWDVSGMKATMSRAYDLTGLIVTPAMRLGQPGDYEREPQFSAGAWRFLAVQLGGLERILTLLRQHLVESGAAGDPIHRARFAAALTQSRSAYLWVREAAARAQASDAGEDQIAFVRLCRGVVENAAMEIIQLAQRSVGTRAFFVQNALDRVCRDLGLYLRQPAPDQARDRAAAAFLDRDCWSDDALW